jgi:hypothetical protein
MEACLESKEPAAVEIESIAVQEEVPKEEAAVKPQSTEEAVWGLTRSHRVLLMAEETDAGHWWPWKTLAAACKGMSRRAIPALHKGHGHQGPGRDSVTRGISKGQTFRKRHQARSECNNSIRNLGVKERLHLGSRRTLNNTFRQTVRLEIAKQSGLPIDCRK